MSVGFATAINALVDVLEAYAPLDYALIIDGPPRDVPDAPDVLAIGFSPTRLAATVSSEPGTMCGPRVIVDVICIANAVRGDEEMRGARDGADVLVSHVNDALNANRRLNDQVTDAQLADVLALDQAQTEYGASAGMGFTVRIET